MSHRFPLLVAVIATAACCGRQKKALPPSPVSTRRLSGAGLLDRPHVTLVAFSDWQSVLKPCGCTAELRRGGIERDAHFVADLRRRDNSVVLLHAGGLLVDDEPRRPRREAQHRERMRTFAAILERMGLAGVALSSRDLERGGREAARIYAASRWPLLAGRARSGVARAVSHRLLTTGSGVRVGLLAVDPADAAEVSARDAAVRATTRELRAAGATVVVALSNLGLRGSRRLGRAVRGLDAIVVGGLPERFEPIREAELGDGAILLPAPRHGAFMTVLTLVPGGSGRWRDVSARMPGAVTRLQARIRDLDEDLERFRRAAGASVSMQRALPQLERQRRELARRLEAALKGTRSALPAGRLAGFASVGLPWSAPVDPGVQRMVAAYDKRIVELNSRVAAAPLAALPGVARYIGQRACLECHEEAAAFARTHPHGRAWTTLLKEGKGRDLDCVPCHATGFLKPGGSAFSNIETFAAVQCEACHGPGSEHRRVEEGGGRSGLISNPGEGVCTTCHTREHSPRFDFRAYRERLLVPGHGKRPPRAR